MQQLRELQIQQGATMGSMVDSGPSVPLSFGNDRLAYEAAQSGVALSDRSHWGKIWVSGDDRIRFLHNQSTGDLQALQPGQGGDTVFVTSTARTIDLATAYLLPDAVLLLVSPSFNQQLIAWMDRYIFFADKVELKDVTDTMAALTLMGPTADALLEKLGLGSIVGQPLNYHQVLDVNGIEVRVAVGSGLAIPGYTLLMNTDRSAELWQTLTVAGAVPLGEQVWQRLRVEQGRPQPGQELTEDYNPLEAGLWHTISLTKGCYIGQETIARLHTYKGVKQQLWGIRLNEAVPPGTAVMAGEEKVGVLTSCVPTEQGYFGLAYIRTKAIEPDLTVQVGDSSGQLEAVPYLSHEYL